MTLIEAFNASLASLRLTPGRAVVAVSGGYDSVALLDLLVRSASRHCQDLVVGHANHGIHPDSQAVAEQVQALALSYDLPVRVGHLDLGHKASETKARKERYAWLEQLRVDLGAGLIFTAHHADDQVETVLMRLLAGSGPAGLAGMASRRGNLVRPLLPFSRSELEQHVRDAGLNGWVDPANSDPRHLRSWIRTDILPALRRRLPDVDSNLLRSARQAARDRAAWNTLLDALPELDVRPENGGISVAGPPLGGYDSPLRQSLILAVARRAGCQLGPTRMGRVLALLESGTSGTRVPLGAGWTAELSFGRLRLYRESASGAPAGAWHLEGSSGERSWGRWNLRWAPGRPPERQERAAMTGWFTWDPITVRAWSAGERMKPLGGRGRRLVVRCFQEAQVPRSRREMWPVLTQGADEIVWIPGVCRSEDRLPPLGSEALRVDAEYA